MFLVWIMDLEHRKDLIVFGNRDIIDESVIIALEIIVDFGKGQFETFIKERDIEKTVSLFEPIKANKLPRFSCPTPKKKPALIQKVSTLKQSGSLFSQLYISCQVREENLEDIFAHENQNFPPSISEHES